MNRDLIKQHEPTLTRVAGLYEVTCTCGWRSDVLYSCQSDAYAAFRRHPTGLPSVVAQTETGHESRVGMSDGRWVAACSCGWTGIVTYEHWNLAGLALLEHLGSTQADNGLPKEGKV